MDTIMDLIKMFVLIENYHKEHGHTKVGDMQSLRNNALALMMELAELIDSTPWKVWRPTEDQLFNKDNAIREVIDILFFLVGICENLEITPIELEAKFEQVLKNNYKRLNNGYSLRGDK